MCIMEVRPGQRAATIAQAHAHNLSTVDRDMDMFVELLTARGDVVTAEDIRHAQMLVHQAYAMCLTCFGMEVARAEADASGHLPHNDDDHGHERSLVAAAHHDAQRARRYETR